MRRFFLLAVLSLSTISGTVRAQQVLVFDPSVIEGNARQAAIDAGYTVTATGDDIFFIDQLSSAAWDLVSVDSPSLGLTPGAIDALIAYIAAGGKAMIGFWNLDAPVGAPLRDAFQVQTAFDYTTPLPVHSWDDTHPIFSLPNLIISPIPVQSTVWFDDGDRLTATVASYEIGGFVPTPTTGEAGIVVGNQERTICNGFVYDSFMTADIVPLLQNEMNFLLTGGVIVEFRRGDANVDAVFDISDPVFQLASLFIPGSSVSTCSDAADTNDDGVLDISDAVYALASLFVIGANPPPDPGQTCGPDPTPDVIDCDDYPSCP